MSEGNRHTSGFTGAIRLLTRFPVPGPRTDADDIARSVPWFPLVGAMVGALVATAYAGAVLVWPPVVAAVVATTVGILATGGFHEDGLADTADGLGGAGAHSTPADALRVMRDPTLGTFGVLALVATFVARVAGLAALDVERAAPVLIAAHCLGRAAAVAGMGAGVAAPHGLGADHARRLRRPQIAAAIFLGLVISVAAMGVWGLGAAVVAAVPAAMLVRLSVRRLGGTTGDVLGAIEQLTEVAVVLAAGAVVLNGWGDPAWWSAR